MSLSPVFTEAGSIIYICVCFAPDIQCCYIDESSCLFYLRFDFDSYVSKIMHF